MAAVQTGAVAPPATRREAERRIDKPKHARSRRLLLILGLTVLLVVDGRRIDRTPTRERVTFLEQLGFVQNPEIAELSPNATGFSVSVANEQVELLDADVIVAFPIFIPTKEIIEDPIFQTVPAVKEGRSVVIDGDLAAAYSLGTTLALDYAVEQMVPRLEKAVA